MPALKYAQQEIQENNNYSTSPIKRDVEVVKVNKENKKQHKSREQLVLMLNTAFLVLIGIFSAGFLVIYSMVAIKEDKLASLHSKINELNFENIELENKLENVKSYYSVDNKVAESNTLDKAKKVIEIDTLAQKEVVHHHPNVNNNLSTATGF